MKHLLSSILIHRKKISCLLLIGCIFGFVLATVKFNITRNYEGIFLLRGKDKALFEVKDDLFLGEEYRYIAGIDLEGGKNFFRLLFRGRASTVKEPSLYYEWNADRGEGFVRNHLPGGKQLLTVFSRFVDDAGKETSGLIVGGGLPAEVRENSILKMNETGMAYFDGDRWYHIWCNANEVVSDARFKPVFPSRWKYLGSRVLHHNSQDLTLESSHEITVEGTPLRMVRTAVFRAGETYFILSVRISNAGTGPVTYYYLYGDEPWLGNYGSSGGNVGWAADGIYQYKGWLNTRKLHYAGLFDFGNDAIGEGHYFTYTANFIAWFGNTVPFVFFSNGPYDFPKINEEKAPLESNERFIGVQWGPRTLQPGQTEEYIMAIGMAANDPKTGFPMMPKISLQKIP